MTVKNPMVCETRPYFRQEYHWDIFLVVAVVPGRRPSA